MLDVPIVRSAANDVTVSQSLRSSGRDLPPSGGSGVALALEVRELTKRFGERTAFSDVSFRVGYGEVFGFLGPNGAGKTTTVRPESRSHPDRATCVSRNSWERWRASRRSRSSH
jgi:ABC-type glutathione transport system ATPase component